MNGIIQEQKARLEGILRRLPAAEQTQVRSVIAAYERVSEDLRRGVMQLQDELDTARLGVKAMQFDLDCTRAERDHARQRLSQLGES